MDFIDRITTDRPLVHRGETEIITSGVSANSLEQDAVCWGLGRQSLIFILKNVEKDSHTLEIGSGLTTLVFAHRQSRHTCITPSKSEIDAILQYALSERIDISGVTFINDFSEVALPTIRIDHALDLVLIDGKHAFPWPFIDWFYTVNHLKKEGLLIVDDTHLITGRLLCNFMKKDPAWEFVGVMDGKTEIFRKKADDIRNVAWHMQPFITEDYASRKKSKTSFAIRLRRKLRALLR